MHALTLLNTVFPVYTYRTFVYFLTYVNLLRSLQSLLKLSGFGRDEQKNRWLKQKMRKHGEHGGKQAELEYSTKMLDKHQENVVCADGQGQKLFSFC